MTASFARFAMAFSLCVGTIAVSSPSASAQGTTRNGKYAYVLSSGAFVYGFSDNFDINNDRIPDSTFTFIYVALGTFRCTQPTTTYSEITQTISSEGTISGNSLLRYQTTFFAEGGYYGMGSATLLIYADTNRNGRFDSGDRTIVNIPATRPLRVSGAIYSFGSR